MIEDRTAPHAFPDRLLRGPNGAPPPSPPLEGVAAPTAGPDTASPTPQPPSRPRPAGNGIGWRFVAILAAATVTVVAAFAIGRLTAPDAPEVPAAAQEAPRQVTADPVIPPATADPVIPPAAAVPGVAGADVVADIAAAVSPTVVQLETGPGLGSGVIYTPAGHILTAAHVVGSSRSVDVRLADGRVVDGRVLGTHDASDIAVVKVDGISDLPVAELGVGVDVRVGQLAVALGSPFGLDQTVTAGIVSAVDRAIGAASMVQTDAAINPGNSGGPLVDSQGRVIGINDQIFSQGGGNDGVGFAVSIDLAVLVADQIVAGEQVQLAFLGVSTNEGPSAEPGALVQEVVAGSAAEAAGVVVGDLIVAVDGRPVQDIGDLRVRIINTRPGTTVTLDVIRGGELTKLEATLGTTSG